VDGDAVANPHELALQVASLKPGQTAKVAVLRDGGTRTVNVTLAALPDDKTTAENGTTEPGERGIGVALAPLSPEARDALKLPAGATGAVIAEVQPGSPAQQAGLRQGDLVVGVGAKPVNGPSDAASAIRSARRDGKAVALRVLRDGQPRYVAIPGPSKG
jgi:serine protease Do